MARSAQGLTTRYSAPRDTWSATGRDIGRNLYYLRAQGTPQGLRRPWYGTGGNLYRSAPRTPLFRATRIPKVPSASQPFRQP
jgi:hypothetical protein